MRRSILGVSILGGLALTALLAGCAMPQTTPQTTVENDVRTGHFGTGPLAGRFDGG